MVPVPTEDFELDPPGSSFWQSLLNLAISLLVVCAAALIGSFLSATSAHAQPAQKATAKGELRIGHPKSAGPFALQNDLDARDVVERNPKVIEALFEDAVTTP